MADILIRGVKMPRNCLYCYCVSYDNDHCVAMDKDIPIYGTKPSWCPLVPLPEKHGRLIDADAPIRAVCYTGKQAPYGTIYETTPYQLLCKHTLLDSPKIVVPAEGGSDVN